MTLYNQVADTLQQERREIKQRELVLSTALDTSPVAIVLVGPTDFIIYSNREARMLFLGGTNLEGLSLTELLNGCPPQCGRFWRVRVTASSRQPAEENREAYSLSRRVFSLNRRQHTLLLLHRITADMERREAEVWKRVIRVISHELNNSLAPLSSLIHSASVVTRKPDHQSAPRESSAAFASASITSRAFSPDMHDSPGYRHRTEARFGGRTCSNASESFVTSNWQAPCPRSRATSTALNCSSCS